jgi:glycine betaine/proline transport system permease protein
MWNPFEIYTIPFGDWVEFVIDWLVINLRFIFQAIRVPVSWVLDNIEFALLALPPLIFLLIIFLIALRTAGWKIAVFSTVSMTFIGFIGAWDKAMTTLSIIITAVIFCIIIGIPLGILAARSDRFESFVRPVLDAMQTTPAFVYLVPVVMLFGVGNVPGILVTIIFALAPIIRFTNLGIRQVPQDVVEASYAFGATPRQILWDIQMPLALKTIMAGLNQTLLLSLAMVVVASMIAVEGLGQMVLRGIGRLDIGLAAIGGIAIVLLAVVLDRITQALGKPSTRPSLYQKFKTLWSKSREKQIETQGQNKEA